jgi:hypothetical protein
MDTGTAADTLAKESMATVSGNLGWVLHVYLAADVQ